MTALEVIWGVWRSQYNQRGIICTDVTGIPESLHRIGLMMEVDKVLNACALIYGPCSREEAEEYVRDME